MPEIETQERSALPLFDERYNYKGIGDCASQCHIRIYNGVGCAENMTIMIATELPSNAGTSVTNWADRLATELILAHAVEPHHLIWVEHYPEERNARGMVEWDESYSRATFKIIRTNLVARPQWLHLSKEEVEALTGATLREVV